MERGFYSTEGNEREKNDGVWGVVFMSALHVRESLPFSEQGWRLCCIPDSHVCSLPVSDPMIGVSFKEYDPIIYEKHLVLTGKSVIRIHRK